MNPKSLLFFLLVSFTLQAQHSQFTWVSGTASVATAPVYGTLGVASATNNPGAKYSCASWKDNSGYLYLFGGSYSGGLYNDLWRYNVNTGEYTWLNGSSSGNQYGSYGTQGVSSSTNTPGARMGAMSWVDNSGNFWLFGGYGYSVPMGFNLGPGYLNDLWCYNVSTNTWTWVWGSSSTYNINGVHGTLGVGTASTIPGSRSFAATWLDNSGNLWMLGGLGFDGSSSTSYSVLNDLWKYSISSNQWTWMGGDVLANYNGNYGTKGLASSTNKPGARRNSAFWKDSSGDFWLFGGYGFPTSFGGTIDPLNDLWKYSVSTNQWTWVSGSDLSYQVGNYGCMGIRSSANVPGARSEMVAWNDGSDVIWIQGGTGRGAFSNGSLNDLWRYETSTNTWTWMKGSSSPGAAAVTGTMGVASTLNIPGSSIAANWVDNAGKFWVYGRPNNVMWRFIPPCSSATLTPAVATPSTQQTCVNSGFSLQATASGTVNWYIKFACHTQLATGNSVVITTPLSANVYTLFAENTNACGGTSALTPVIVTVEPLPAITAANGTICSGKSFTINPTGAASYSFSSGPVVSPLVKTTYTVYGTSSVGCQNKTTLTVAVAPNPTISVSNATICSGTTYTLAPTGATTYTYLNGGPAITPTVSDSYSITGSSSLGCLASNTAIATISLLQSPTLSVSNGTVCSGTSFVFTPTGAVSYSITGNSFTVTPPSTSSYTLRGMGSNGCTQSVVAQVVALPLPTISISNGSICLGDTYSLSPQGAVNYTYSSGSPLVNPTSQTSYTIEGASNVNGCTTKTVATVSVFPLPVIAVAGGTLCEGSTFTINPSGAASYSFSSGSSTISPTITSSYSVTGTSTAGCLSPTPAVLQVTVFSSPIITVNSGTICEGNVFTLTPSGAVSYTFSGGTSMVSPTITSSYSVSGTNSLGCISQQLAVADITVFPNPTISVNSGTLCEGNTFTLIPSGASGYTFSSGTSIVSPSITSSYSVVGISSNGCLSATSAVANIIVYPIPIISVNSGTICEGSTFTLVPSGAANYSYSSGTPMVSPATTSSYSVSGVSSFGCSSATIAVANVSVVPSPVLSVNSGTLCEGNTFTLIPSGASSYTYSSGTSTVAPSITSTYTVLGSDNLGCLSLLPVTATVSVFSAPLISANSGSICSGSSFTILPTGAISYTYSSGTPIVSPLATTGYSVIGTDTNGCISLNPGISLVSVLPLPTVSVANGTVCVGEFFQISPSGADTYIYSSGTPTVSPLSTTVYTVTGTLLTGCVSSSTLLVTVNPLPMLNISSNPQLLCSGEVATLTASGAMSYTWNNGSIVDTDLVVTPTTSETFSVTGVDANNCLGTATYVLQVDNCNGLYEKEVAKSNPLPFPNPNSGAFAITAPEAGMLRILDLNGKLVYETELDQGLNNIQLRNFDSGLYYLQIRSTTRLSTSKLLIDPQTH